jgi:hypothetical protein
MAKYELVNYFDVWGNEKNGYEVNNLCKEGQLELPENATNKDIIHAIKAFGFFKKHVRTNMLDISNDWEMIEIDQRRNGMPICRLEIIREIGGNVNEKN